MSVFLHDITKKTDAARMIELDVEMFHGKSWISIYFGIKRSKVKVTSHNNTANVGLCILVSARFF